MISRALRSFRKFGGGTGSSLAGLLAVCLCFASGCAAVSNPVADGIPAKRLPPEYQAPRKDDLRYIPLTTLGQPRPAAHILAAEDLLGVYIEGFVGGVVGDDKARDQSLPVQANRDREFGNIPPAIGYPIPVSADGTLPLPQIDPPLKVTGMTVLEAQEAIRKAYTVDRKLLQKDKRIFVTLMRPRQFRVQVVRQETPQITFTGGLQTNTQRGQGFTVDLPAYENDVLNALNRTGGLPGLDSINEVIIQRHVKGNEDVKVVRIPLRTRAGSALPFQPKDVILDNGDVVFIAARDTEVYYVGGLTIPRQATLPRDYDLTVTKAVALSGGPLVNGGLNANNFNGSLIASGLGSPSPSLVTVIRRTKNNGQIKIIVDLNKALNDPREDPIVQTGDLLILQESLGDAVTRYLTTTFRWTIFNSLVEQRDLRIFGNPVVP